MISIASEVLTGEEPLVYALKETLKSRVRVSNCSIYLLSEPAFPETLLAMSVQKVSRLVGGRKTRLLRSLTTQGVRDVFSGVGGGVLRSLEVGLSALRSAVGTRLGGIGDVLSNARCSVLGRLKVALGGALSVVGAGASGVRQLLGG